MWSRTFWLDLAERAIKSGAQFAALAWGAATFTKVGEVAPTATLAVLAFLFGAVASALTSLASAEIGNKGTASAVPSVSYKKEGEV